MNFRIFSATVLGGRSIDYIYSPRSNIYLGCNGNRNTLDTAQHKVSNRMLLFKFTYLWSV